MYYPNQILRNKKTNQLARINDYLTRDKIQLIDKNNKKIVGTHEDWTHLEDWFGRAVAPKTYEEAEEYAKQALVSKRTRSRKRREALEKWKNKILDLMSKQKIVERPFADGSSCYEAEKYFLKSVNAKPLYTPVDQKNAKYGNECRIEVFEHLGRKWINSQYSLVEIEKD